MGLHEFVKYVITHPRVWPYVSEDGMEPEEYEPSETSIYIRHGEHGFMEFRQVGKYLYDCHISMLPKAHGVKEFVAHCIEFMQDSGARKILASIPSENKSAIFLANKCGFEREGYIKKALFRHGKMIDVVLMGYVCRVQ